MSKLIGDRFKINNTDFETVEDNQVLCIQPDEDSANKKTVPFTSVAFHESNSGVDVVVTSRLRQIDLGATQLMFIFCGLLFVASGVLLTLFRNEESVIGFAVFALASLVLGSIIYRLYTGYFDYIRQTKNHLNSLIN